MRSAFVHSAAETLLLLKIFCKSATMMWNAEFTTYGIFTLRQFTALHLTLPRHTDADVSISENSRASSITMPRSLATSYLSAFTAITTAPPVSQVCFIRIVAFHNFEPLMHSFDS
jgi:hypothetical protein